MLYTSPPNGWIGYPRVSPAGDLIAFFDHPEGYGSNGTVAVIDPAGHKRTLSSGYAMSHGIAWSPAGDEVWFSAAGRGEGFALRAVTLSGEHRLVWRNPGPFDLDDISTDGRALVTLIDVRVGAVGRPPDADVERDLSWLGWTDVSDLSPDGATLLFHEHGYRSVREGEGDLYLWRMDGSQPIRLGKGEALGLSPDGKWAVSLQMTPAATLVLVPTGPGHSRALPRGGIEWYDRLSWLPDGRRIVFSAGEPAREGRCYVQDIDGGLPRPITPEGVQTSNIRRLLPTPDGQFIAAEGPDHRLALYPVRAAAHRGRFLASSPTTTRSSGAPIGGLSYVRGRREVSSADLSDRSGHRTPRGLEGAHAGRPGGYHRRQRQRRAGPGNAGWREIRLQLHSLPTWKHFPLLEKS